jgi:N-dimethylarginine dimethylaminohydrolase
MGDPRHFRIRGGANPHTRTRWGLRKTVNRAKAVVQWHGLAGVLKDLGVQIHVLPPREASPGMVFPANAGFMTDLLAPLPPGKKTFLLSTALPSRSAEKDVYAGFVRAMGFPTAEVPFRFEGEADLFPAGGRFIFTSGRLEEQRFVPAAGWPPYRRVYGFRSDAGALPALLPFCGGREVLPLTLVRETHYHGDTCLCSFGKDREFLMAYLPALDAPSQRRLKEAFGEKLLPMSEEDGELFSANSFQVEDAGTLLMPHTATERLRAQVRERGTRTATADVSEFLLKGGGSVKCMIGDLGAVPGDHALPLETRYDFVFPKGAG